MINYLTKHNSSRRQHVDDRRRCDGSSASYVQPRSILGTTRLIVYERRERCGFDVWIRCKCRSVDATKRFAKFTHLWRRAVEVTAIAESVCELPLVIVHQRFIDHH